MTSNTLDDVKFGFEYETLVEVQNPLFHNLLSSFKQLQRKGLLSEGTAVKCRVRPTANNRTLTRFMLATVFDRIEPTVSFKAARGYHAETCDPIVFEDNASLTSSLKNRASSWVITHDGSVRVLTAEDLADATAPALPLYKDFSSIVDPIKSVVRGVQPKKEKILENLEIVSPILLASDLREPIPELGTRRNPVDKLLREILPANDSFVFWNNEKTSNHVHLSIQNRFSNDPTALLKAVMAWWYFEPLFLILVGHWRRNNPYCQPLRKVMYRRHADQGSDNLRTMFQELGSNLDIRAVCDVLELPMQDVEKQIVSLVEVFQGTDHDDRYAALNLLNALPGGYGTIEVRLKQGSSSSLENTRFMQLLGLFFVAAVNNDIVTKTMSKKEKDALWDLYDPSNEVLAGYLKDVWTTQTRLDLSFSPQANPFDMVAKFLLRGNPKDQPLCQEVLAYWQDVLTQLGVRGVGGNKKGKSTRRR